METAGNTVSEIVPDGSAVGDGFDGGDVAGLIP
jgi:hypothetical protein